MKEPAIIYADCTGSGEVDRDLDAFVSEKILPYYANVHSDSFCSNVVSSLIRTSRGIVKRACVRHINEYACIFTGQGMTGATRHLGHLLHDKVHHILYTELEHISNSSLWESIYKDACVHVVNVSSTDSSIIDSDHLEQLLYTIIDESTVLKQEGIILVAFTACSNVLGSIQPVSTIIQTIKKYHKAASLKKFSIVTCVDCAACSPYVPLVSLCKDSDAIVLSPHKFKGGQCTPGVLIVKRCVIKNETPFFPGGGTVWYKEKKESNHFLPNIELREEGGTPNIIGIIRVGLLFSAKQCKQRYITKRLFDIVTYVDRFFLNNTELLKRIEVYSKIGRNEHQRLPIYSFRVKDIHSGLFVKILSDAYGIQARSGVLCCYMLAEKMCSLSKQERKHILAGKGAPSHYGWVRISFYYEFTEELIRHILNCIEHLVFNIHDYKKEYTQEDDGQFYNAKSDVNRTVVPKLVRTIFSDMRAHFC